MSNGQNQNQGNQAGNTQDNKSAMPQGGKPQDSQGAMKDGGNADASKTGKDGNRQGGDAATQSSGSKNAS